MESFDNSLRVPANNMGDSRRGSSYSLYKLNKTERAAFKHEKEIDETLQVTSLTHVLQVPVDKKDFSKEIRATKDIKDFVEKSEVMTSVVDLEKIVFVAGMIWWMGMKIKIWKEIVQRNQTKLALIR